MTKFVRIREFGPTGGQDLYPDTDHDTTVTSLVSEGWVITFDSVWDTDLQRDAYRRTVTTVH